MKRTRSIRDEKTVTFVESTTIPDINTDFLQQCDKEFNENPSNIISRNAIVAIGSMISTTNSNRINDIDHVFMNSIKKKNIKSTNQGHSGRCWLFSGLNMFRHSVIQALDLENFEFSETYLFFWDKLERSNSYLRWFIDHPKVEITDISFTYMVSSYMTDGGWWNTFTNLVTKYGLIPKSAMKETWQSNQSDDMNQILNERLQSCANFITKNRHLPKKDLLKIKEETIKQIYSILVKFLGEPPKHFRWPYTNENNESVIMDNMDPKMFINMLLPNIDMNDFIVLSHIPTKELKYKKLYELKYTNNVYEGTNCKLINLPINELSKYAQKSILAGMPVWFASDVSQDFNPYHSSLDDQLSDSHLVFGNTYKFDKGEKITFRHLQANHAMSLIGINIDSKGHPESWQVENSWGYWDNETPGEDGFLYMSHSWFKKNVIQIVVHKNFLSRTIQKLLLQKPELLDPWDSIAPALKIKPVDAPKNYIEMLKRK